MLMLPMVQFMEKKSSHWIGMEIHLTNNTITLFHCGLPNEDINVDIRQIEILQMLECLSLGLKNMSDINDDNAMDLLSMLCCEIFDQFMDRDFKEATTGLDGYTLKKRTIKFYDCGLQTEDINIDIPQVENLAVLIPALMLEAVGEEINKKDLVPFHVEKAEGLPKTNIRCNCVLFVLNMLECNSLKIEDMSKINDDNAHELRRSLSCEIFNQCFGEVEFNRIRGTFLGLVIKLGERNLKLSAKIFHAVLTKSITTGEVEGPREENERFEWEFLHGPHTENDVKKQLRNTNEDASDERFCLAMLLLIESILLQKVSGSDTTFPLDYVKITYDIDVLMTYPWGRIAYELLKSLKNAVKKNVDKNKYDLHGYPLAFHLWILESVPLLSPFSKVVPILDVQPSTPIFLCEKYIDVKSPQLIDVLQIENTKHLKVTCILPPIMHDPEADVFMEDEVNKDLDDMADLSKRGYKFKISEWRNMSVDLYEAHEEIKRSSLLFGNEEIRQPSSSNEDSKELNVRVSELEKRQRVTSDDNLNNETDAMPLNETRHGEASPDQVTSDENLNNEDIPEPMTEIISPNISKIPPLTRTRIILLREQKKEKRVQESVSSDRIRPQPPPEEPQETKSFELMAYVDVYHNDVWCSGRVHTILSDDKYYVCFDGSKEFIQFNREVHQTQSVKPSQQDHVKKHIDVAFTMLNCRRIEQATWFHDRSLPTACFLPVLSFERVGYRFESLKKPPKRGIKLLEGYVGEVVRGDITPRKIWLEDVNVIYGAIHNKKSSHFIGMEIHLTDNTITLFDCGLSKKMSTLPFLKSKNWQMLECKELGLKDMSKIIDDNAMDLRTKLCCEIFDQFMDKDFKEVYMK
ncbi:hypothetical protein F2Q69_00034993 [Brassica cretica]|uniref:Ubiquitin-like protease family profile domain-containing protein n=1 Tax=Brassica cretica TaxID=69181 RepID=A0A8S9SMY4_BRACR|nr:hypothetical protein F2Q69_00034993 [Brassica cretica]